MSNETYRRFDPWRTAPVKEEVRKQIVASHYFNVDHVAFNSSEVGHFERYLVQENGGDTVGVLAVTEDGQIPLVEQYRFPPTVGRWKFRRGMPFPLTSAHWMWPHASYAKKRDSRRNGSASSLVSSIRQVSPTNIRRCFWPQD